MTKNDIKVQYEYVGSKEYKLSDFIQGVSEFFQFDDFSWFDCENIEDNLIMLEKLGKIHFENKIAICLTCKSKNIVKKFLFPLSWLN